MTKIRKASEAGFKSVHRRRVDLLPYLLVAPALIMVFMVIGYPLVSNLWGSLHNGHLVSPQVKAWVGLKHYSTIVHDPQLRRVALNSLSIAGGTTLFSLALGFVWALGINRLKRGHAGLQIILLMPWILSGVLTARLWTWLLDPIFGLLNSWLVRYILRPLIGFQGSLELTSNAHLAALTVILAGTWRMFPFIFVMILAGLEIPKEFYEAAMVDGATPVQLFRHITLPALRFILAIVSLLSFVWVFNDFSIIFVMTKGGPGFVAMVLPFRVYRFVIDGFRLGIGSALSMLMVSLLVVLAILYVRLLRRQSNEGSVI